MEEEIGDLSTENFGELSSAYLKTYIHTARFLDKQYFNRKEDDGRFMMGDSTLSIDDMSEISINGRHFKWTRVLWELLIRKNVNRGFVITDELKS